MNSAQYAYAIYFLPDDDEMKFIGGEAIVSPCLLENESLKSGFILAPYEETNSYPKILINKQNYICGKADIKEKYLDISPKTQDSETTPMAKADYENAVAKLVSDLKNDTDFSKGVLARTKEICLDNNFSAFDLLEKLKTLMPKAFCFIVNTPQSGMWMGATPERLLKIKENKGYTCALAGTLPAESNLEWSEKEIVEQRFVDYYISEKLTKIGINNFTKSELKTIKSGTVKHLLTDFNFEIKNEKDIVKIIDTLHPTPAVCGMPLAKAKNAIKKYENTPRSYYSGYLGTINIDKESQLFVNLRSMQVHKNSATLYVGAGITEGSVPEKEWEETEVKAKTLLNAIEG